MRNIKRDVETGLYFLKALPTIDKIDDEYDFPFERTNEDLENFFPEFPIKNGIVATVAGSGDQQLQIAKENPKEIYVFDRNPFAIHMSKLKTAAAIALPYEEYMSYFKESGRNQFDIEIYKTIRDLLDKETRDFWDRMYINGRFENTHAYLVQNGDKHANRGKNSYELEENFMITKNNLSTIKILYFYQELFEFFEKLPKNVKFNAVFLSNIFDWLPLKQKEVFVDFIKSDVGKKLLKNGMISVYSPPRGSYYYTGLEKSFPDAIDLGHKEKVLVYKK